MNDKIIDELIDVLYSQYKSDHSMRTTVHNHPMFRNGTFSENNEYIPEEPEQLLTKEEFKDKIEDDADFKWGFGLQVLYIYHMNYMSK